MTSGGIGSPVPGPSPEGIWIYAEHRRGKLHAVAGEVLAEARRLARDLSCRVQAIAVAKGTADLVSQIAPHAPDAICLIDDPALDPDDPEALADALCSMVEERRPRLLLIGATRCGEDLAARLSARLRLGALTRCVNIRRRRGALEGVRTLEGGRLHAAVVSLTAQPYIITVEPGAVGVAPPQPGAKPQPVPQIERMPRPVPQRPPTLSFLGERRSPAGSLDLREAEVIVAGGAGMGSNGLRLLEDLADALGGAVGCTRVAADFGWIPRERQIGQTGKSVSPRLYIACGISGALQHTAGLKGSPTIIAINRDSAAPIFKIADLGIIGDALEVVPALTALVRSKGRAFLAETG